MGTYDIWGPTYNKWGPIYNNSGPEYNNWGLTYNNRGPLTIAGGLLRITGGALTIIGAPIILCVPPGILSRPPVIVSRPQVIVPPWFKWGHTCNRGATYDNWDPLTIRGGLHVSILNGNLLPKWSFRCLLGVIPAKIISGLRIVLWNVAVCLFLLISSFLLRLFMCMNTSSLDLCLCIDILSHFFIFTSLLSLHLTLYSPMQKLPQSIHASLRHGMDILSALLPLCERTSNVESIQAKQSLTIELPVIWDAIIWRHPNAPRKCKLFGGQHCIWRCLMVMGFLFSVIRELQVCYFNKSNA